MVHPQVYFHSTTEDDNMDVRALQPGEKYGKDAQGEDEPRIRYPPFPPPSLGPLPQMFPQAACQELVWAY